MWSLWRQNIRGGRSTHAKRRRVNYLEIVNRKYMVRFDRLEGHTIRGTMSRENSIFSDVH